MSNSCTEININGDSTSNYFSSGKYTNWYLKLVSNAKKLNRKKKPRDGLEKHHILPKSIAKHLTTVKDNLVVLTPREHFVCHMLLAKMCILPEHKLAMKRAFVVMVNTFKDSSLQVCSRSYILAAKYNSEVNSGNNNASHQYKEKHGKHWMEGDHHPNKDPSRKEEYSARMKDCWDDAEFRKARTESNNKYWNSDRSRAISVMCVETGEVFRSINQAQIKHNNFSNAIYAAIKNPNKLACGYHWVRVEK